MNDSTESENFARRHGAGIVELLEITNCATYKEFMDTTTPADRELLITALEERHKESNASLPSVASGGV